MGRECRRVPLDWEHPKNERGSHVPLFNHENFADDVARWEEGQREWQRGNWVDSQGRVRPLDPPAQAETYAEFAGERPDPKDYMPLFRPEEAGAYRMYETTTEGTPISPAFETREALAEWLVDHASLFGDRFASRDRWMEVIEESLNAIPLEDVLYAQSKKGPDFSP